MSIKRAHCSSCSTEKWRFPYPTAFTRNSQSKRAVPWPWPLKYPTVECKYDNRKSNNITVVAIYDTSSVFTICHRLRDMGSRNVHQLTLTFRIKKTTKSVIVNEKRIIWYLLIDDNNSLRSLLPFMRYSHDDLIDTRIHMHMYIYIYIYIRREERETERDRKRETGRQWERDNAKSALQSRFSKNNIARRSSPLSGTSLLFYKLKERVN